MRHRFQIRHSGTLVSVVPAALWVWLAFVFLARAVPVTFQVNMQVQAGTGNFSPSTDTVEVRGSFNGWSAGVTLSASSSNTNVYQGTVEVTGAAGTQVQYKFVMNRGGTMVWENDGVGPAGAQNRAFSLTNSAQTLPVVYFNNQSTPPGVTAVTFQVNMAVQQSITNFDPAAHSVEARGSFNGWGAGITLSPSQTNSLIYQATTNVSGSPGTQFEYKFVINKAGTLVWEANVGPGGPSGNRVLTLAAGNQFLPVAYFNNLTNNPGAGIPVTFRVSAAVPVAQGRFTSNSIAMVVAGPFNNWSTTASRLTNSPGSPYLFVGTVNMTTASPGSSIPFKFVANGSNWEAGDDRSFVLGSSAQTLPIEYFDRTNHLGPLTISLNSPFEGAAIVTLSWTAGPHVRLQTASGLSASSWRDVPGTAGQSSHTIDLTFEIEPRPGFFRLVGP